MYIARNLYHRISRYMQSFRTTAIILFAALFFGSCSSPQPDPLPDSEYLNLDLESIQAYMDSGRVTAVSLTQFYLNRIAELDDAGPMLNAVIEINPDVLSQAAALDDERAQTGSRGPMHGVPVILKANIDTRDNMATTAGSLALEGHKPGRDAFHVERLRSAGAIILAMGNLSEWANFRSSHSSSGWSSIGGQTKNPYVLDRNPCGSSSGPAVAVSAHLTQLGVGTETDGSIMCPSGYNGIVGVKPTVGLVSRDGIIPIAHSQDTAGPMARSVKDAAIMLQVMASKDVNDPASQNSPDIAPDYLAGLASSDLSGIRVGVYRDYSGAGENTGVEAAFESSIEALRAAGADIVDPVVFPDLEGMGQAEGTVLNYEFKNDIRVYLERHDSPNGMTTLADLIAFNEANEDRVMPYFAQERFMRAEEQGPLTDQKYLDDLGRSKRISREAIDGVVNRYKLDAIIAPTNSPAHITSLENGDNWSGSVGSASLPAVSGYPNVTVPMGFVDGLPVGLSFFGRAYSEPVLLQIAYAFEQKTTARKSPKFLEGPAN